MKDRRSVNLSLSTLSYRTDSPSPVDVPDGAQAEKGAFLFPPHIIDTGLPSPLIKHAQQMQARQSIAQRIFNRWTIAVLILTSFITWRILVFSISSSSTAPSTLEHITTKTPEAVLFADSKGHRRWTVSVPPNSTFPLPPHEYAHICSSAHNVATTLDQHQKRFFESIYSSSPEDASYMDVSEAMDQGVIATSNELPITVIGQRPQADASTCERSLTYVLDSEEAGFGKSLLSLWLSYGLARREKRAFFVEDSRWQYGSYLSFFPSPPQAACLPPPSTHVVPCPRQAAHLLVSSATLSHTFGSDFHDQYLSAYRSSVASQRRIFQMVRDGYEALFALNGEDAAYAQHRSASLREQAGAGHHPIIGMHVRHGDRHPFEYEFGHDYLPLERFAAAASHIISSTPKPAAANASEPIPLYIASDDPDVAVDHNLAEMEPPIRLERAQELIVLASKRNLQQSEPVRQPNSAFVKHVDEVVAWEGGFFASLFRNLGRSKRLPHTTFSSAREQREQMEALYRARQGGIDRELTEEERKAEDNAAAMRQLVGRGFLLDIDVLSHSDSVVCAVSSATCRILAVMMGWDKVKAGNWVNVDDGRSWSWDGEH